VLLERRLKLNNKLQTTKQRKVQLALQHLLLRRVH
jgi:hypothetical protein